MSTLNYDLMKEVLDRKGEFKFHALGNSMYPLIKSGDILTIKSIEHDEIRIGDVIVYKIDDDFVAHRVLKKADENNDLSYITKGDSMVFPDPPIHFNEILGRVITLERSNKIKKINSLSWKLLGLMISNFYYIIYTILRHVKSIFT